MATVDFNLYLITDRRQVPGGDLVKAVRAALAGGVRAVQLREKDLPARDLLALARQLRALTRGFGAQLLINDRLDVALAAEADGVHLAGGSLPVAEARALLGPDRLIGVSTHHRAEVASAAGQGADFVTFGPVYHTPSKARYGSPVGLDRLREACAACPLPVFALGGVKHDRIADILNCGTHGIAMISAILACEDPCAATRALLLQLNTL